MQLKWSRGNEIRMMFLKCKDLINAYILYEHICEKNKLIKSASALQTVVEQNNELLAIVKDEREKSKEQTNMLGDCLKQLSTTTMILEQTSSNSTIQPKQPSLKSCFAVFKLTNNSVYICRGQKYSINAIFRKIIISQNQRQYNIFG